MMDYLCCSFQVSTRRFHKKKRRGTVSFLTRTRRRRIPIQPGSFSCAHTFFGLCVVACWSVRPTLLRLSEQAWTSRGMRTMWTAWLRGGDHRSGLWTSVPRRTGAVTSLRPHPAAQCSVAGRRNRKTAAFRASVRLKEQELSAKVLIYIPILGRDI